MRQNAVSRTHQQRTNPHDCFILFFISCFEIRFVTKWTTYNIAECWTWAWQWIQFNEFQIKKREKIVSYEYTVKDAWNLNFETICVRFISFLVIMSHRNDLFNLQIPKLVAQYR